MNTELGVPTSGLTPHSPPRGAALTATVSVDELLTVLVVGLASVAAYTTVALSSNVKTSLKAARAEGARSAMRPGLNTRLDPGKLVTTGATSSAPVVSSAQPKVALSGR